MSIIGDVKDLIDLAKNGLTVDLQHKLMEMQRSELSLRADNLSLRQQIKELEDSLSEQGQLHFDGKLSWLKRENEQDVGPFCQFCAEDSGKLIRLQEKTMPLRGGGGYIVYQCYKCKNVYEQ